MAVDFASIKYDNPAENQRAFRAVRRMNEMVPMLTAVLRAMTSRPDVFIKIHAGTPQTDGKCVWLRPSIELGDNVQHDRANCSRRDDKSHPICPACAQMEKVQETFFHEMAHIVANSFQAIQDHDKTDLMNRIVTEHPGTKGSRLAKIQRMVAEANDSSNANYMGIASLVSPFLPTLINALEDARVNRAMYQVRAGTYHMFRSKIISVFEDGIEMLDGTTFHWSGEDENAQAIIGVLCMACGVAPRDGWLSAPVLVAMGDPALSATIAALEHTALTAADIYRASFGVLEHLRRLGFCRAPDDQEDDEPDPKPEPQDSQQTEGDPDEQESDDADPGEDSEESTVGEGGQPDDAPEAGTEEQSDDSSGDDVPERDEQPDDNDEQSSGDDEGPGDADDDTDESDSDADGDESGDRSDDGDDSDGEGSDGSDDGDNELEDEAASASGEQPATGSNENSADGEDFDDDAEDGSEPSSGDPDADGDSGQDDQEAGDTDEQGEETSSAGTPEEGDESDDESDDEADERMNASDPDNVQRLVLIFGGHDPDTKPDDQTERQLGVAIIQAEQFDEPSSTVTQVNVHTFDKPTHRSRNLAWKVQGGDRDGCRDLPEVYELEEATVGATLLKMRTVFADNQRAKRAGELRSGRVNSQRLPSVMAGNTKVFTRDLKPGARDYFVLLALDVSSSTTGTKLEWIKKMGMSIGSLLSRSGVKFAIYAHTGSPLSYVSGRDTLYEADVFVVKEEHDPWDQRTKLRLSQLNASGNNLDGHALEFFRKRCEKSHATDKVLLYVTDGSMPEANSRDETVVLKRELKICQKKGIPVIGVGIATDSPTRHGLDTVQINEPRDINKLIAELGKRLAVVRC